MVALGVGIFAVAEATILLVRIAAPGSKTQRARGPTLDFWAKTLLALTAQSIADCGRTRHGLIRVETPNRRLHGI